MCFAMIRHSNTEPNDAIVATILNTLPIAADRIGDRYRAAGAGFLLFALFRLAAIADPVGSGLST
jgi:hypothetical protein